MYVSNPPPADVRMTPTDPGHLVGCGLALVDYVNKRSSPGASGGPKARSVETTVQSTTCSPVLYVLGCTQDCFHKMSPLMRTTGT